jgi:hypothetical protein
MGDTSKGVANTLLRAKKYIVLQKVIYNSIQYMYTL